MGIACCMLLVCNVRVARHGPCLARLSLISRACRLRARVLFARLSRSRGCSLPAVVLLPRELQRLRACTRDPGRAEGAIDVGALRSAGGVGRRCLAPVGRSLCRGRCALCVCERRVEAIRACCELCLVSRSIVDDGAVKAIRSSRFNCVRSWLTRTRFTFA